MPPALYRGVSVGLAQPPLTPAGHAPIPSTPTPTCDM